MYSMSFLYTHCFVLDNRSVTYTNNRKKVNVASKIECARAHTHNSLPVREHKLHRLNNNAVSEKDTRLSAIRLLRFKNRIAPACRVLKYRTIQSLSAPPDATIFRHHNPSRPILSAADAFTLSLSLLGSI